MQLAKFTDYFYVSPEKKSEVKEEKKEEPRVEEKKEAPKEVEKEIQRLEIMYYTDWHQLLSRYLAPLKWRIWRVDKI